MGSIIGIFISSIAGAAVWGFTIIKTGKMIYLLLGIVYLMSYLIIRFLTRQSSNNVVVFIASFISTLIALPLGIWFAGVWKP